MSMKETPRGSDENLQYSAASDSFWDVGNFKRTVKRIDDGAKLCDEFMKLVTERADIEAKYALKLKAWSKKWEECIRNGPEYGTMEVAMRGTASEAESRAEVHMQCRDKLMEEILESIKKWKNENFHKGIFQWKETKEAEEGFTRAQKPWAKRLAKVERSKKAFHNASRNTEQAQRLENEASNDTDPKSADKLRKLQDATEKAKREMEKCKEKYELRLDEISSYNSQYERDMIQEFEKCQENEDKRLGFFRDTLIQYHKCLDISESPEFAGIFVNSGLTFQKADAQADLDWWSRNHGTGMPQNWPMFEELKHPIQKLHIKRTLFRKFPAKLSKHNTPPQSLSSGVSVSSEETLDKLDTSKEHEFVKKSETTESGNLISFNADDSASEGVIYSYIDSTLRCDEALNNVVNTVQQPQDRDFSPAIVKSVEAIQSSSGTEILYSEILDVSIRNQVVSDSRSQEGQSVGQPCLQDCNDKELDIVHMDNSTQAELSQEYNEFPVKRPSTTSRSTSQEQAPAAYSYPTTQNHVEDNTDYSHQNEINPFDNNYTTATSDDFSGPSAKDEWEIEPPPIEDAGVPVRALYDFQGVEEDELNFREGDILTQLSSQDDQGWCQGRFQGKVGHFPGSYVEPL